MEQKKRKTYTQDYGDKGRSAANKFKQGRESIVAWDVPDTVHWHELLVDKKLDLKKLKVWLKENAQTGVKWSGITTLWMMEYVTRGLNALLVDNAALRAMERGISGKKKGGFVRNNPAFVSHIIYWGMMVGILIGGKAIADRSDSDEDDLRSTVEMFIDKFGSDDEEETVEVMPNTYGAYRAKMQSAMPMIVAELVAMEGVRMKNGMHVVYDDATGLPLKPGQEPKGKATIGYGNTVGKDHEEISSNTPPITSEEAFELSRWHLEDKETFLLMYCYDVACKGVNIETVPEAMAIASAAYNGFNLVIEKQDVSMGNRFKKIRDLHEEFGDALTDEHIRKCFEEYPIKNPAEVGKYWLNGGGVDDCADAFGWYINVNKDGDGIRWRRWLEACIMTGDITPQDLLQIPINGMSEFFDLVGRDRDNWFIVRGSKDNETRTLNKKTLVKFKEWLKNPVDKNKQSLATRPKVCDVMPEDAVAKCREYSGEKLTDVKKVTKTKQQKIIEKKTYVIGYEEEYANAVAEYQKGKYQNAAVKYEAMIKKYPDNALLRNDLAATYNKLGRYDDAIVQAREVLKRIGDRSQYGAAQYNAGFAYEQMGNLQKALANYKLALANGNRRVQKDITRVSEKLKRAGNKKVAFNSGTKRVSSEIKQIHQKNAKSDLLLYGKEFYGNMA